MAAELLEYYCRGVVGVSGQTGAFGLKGFGFNESGRTGRHLHISANAAE